MTNSKTYISIPALNFRNFSENKSQIGQTKISPIKEKDKNYQIDMMSSTFSENGRGKDGFYY